MSRMSTAASVIALSLKLYNPATGTWSATGGMTFRRYSQTATVLVNGTVLVAGGYVAVRLPNGRVLAAGGLGAGVGYQSSAEVYTP